MRAEVGRTGARKGYHPVPSPGRDAQSVQVEGGAQSVGEGAGETERWSNQRVGSSPASLESGSGESSVTSGVPKMSRTCGRTPGKLIGCLPDFRTTGGSPGWAPADLQDSAVYPRRPGE